MSAVIGDVWINSSFGQHQCVASGQAGMIPVWSRRCICGEPFTDQGCQNVLCACWRYGIRLTSKSQVVWLPVSGPFIDTYHNDVDGRAKLYEGMNIGCFIDSFGELQDLTARF